MKKYKKNKPLGIGLEALIPSYQTDDKKENYIDHIDIKIIIPNSNQPRQIFMEDNMQKFYLLYPTFTYYNNLTIEIIAFIE